MIKKIILFLGLSMGLFAHELLLFVEDNKDNTIKVIGEFDTGDSAEGALVKLESLVSGVVLFQQRLPKESEIVVNIPKEPYQVILDSGMEGHVLIKKGIAPLEGFLGEQNKATSNNKITKIPESILAKWDFLTISFFSLCLVAFLLAIYFSNRNTNSILEKIKLNK